MGIEKIKEHKHKSETILVNVLPPEIAVIKLYT